MPPELSLSSVWVAAELSQTACFRGRESASTQVLRSWFVSALQVGMLGDQSRES